MAVTTMFALSTRQSAPRPRHNLREDAVLPSWFAVAQKLHSLPNWGRYALATLLVLVTFFIRYALMGDAPGYHFIFFVPPVILSSLFLAQGSGIWAVLLSAALLGVFLLPPIFPVDAANKEDFLALSLFLGTGLVTSLTSEALHQAFFRLAEANAKLMAAYERIAASEREKELLLHELTHRFKNDLANLTAILRLQARNVTDPSARTELMAASDRVHVMGRVHQRLTRHGELVEVHVRSFISDLCEDLRIAMIGSRPITLQANIIEGQFPLAQAMTIGLVINELVTNALKYAFPDDRAGSIKVQLTRVSDEFRLVVADDGVGESASTPDSSGLGQRLIQAMALQLQGSYVAERRADGRICTLRFPAPALPSS